MSINENDEGKRRIKKPGLSEKKLSAFESIKLARAQGTSRISQYARETADELNKQPDIDEGNDSYDEKEFVEYGDESERRMIEEDDEEQDYVEPKSKKKNTKKKGNQAQGAHAQVSKPADNQTILKYTKTSAAIGVTKPKKNEKNEEELKLKSANLLEDLMKNVFDGTGDRNVSYEAKTTEEKFQKDEKWLFKSKLEKEKELLANEILLATRSKQIEKQDHSNNENDKKRKRDEFESNMDLEDPSDFSNMSAIDNLLANNKMETIKEEDSMTWNDGIDEILEQQRKMANASLESRLEKEKKQDQDRANEVVLNSNQEELPELPSSIGSVKDYSSFTEEDGSMYFYWIDAYEEMNSSKGTVFLFGKIYNRRKGGYETACVVVKGMERQIFFSLKPEYENETSIQNHVFQEIHQIMMEKVFKSKSSSLAKYTAKDVARKYAFQLDIPRNERKYIKVNYSFEYEALDYNTKGKTFDFVLGTTYPALELFLIKRKIRGPCWLRVEKFKIPDNKNRSSWCAHEFVIDSKKDIGTLSLKGETLAPPPLRIMSISFKSHRNPDTKQNEIVAFSCAFLQNVDIDTVKENSKPPYYFSGLRKMAKNIPNDFEKKRKERNLDLYVIDSENKLLDYFVTKVNQFDPDVLVGHDLYGKIFDLLIERALKLKIPAYNLSKVGRLRKGGNIPKSNANIFKTRFLTSGRLLCDTYSGVREVIRETDYSLAFLAKKYLSTEHDEIDSDGVAACFEKTMELLYLINHSMKDAYLTQELNFKFQMLPLTKQLTCLAGNLWIKSLQQARAERNEMLLIHEFHKNKYIWPDKFSMRSDKMSTKEFLEEEEGGGQKNPEKGSKKKNKKKYAGGLVLEPKSGLYESIILLLDFNSLYPSIIQEYNVCFTTGKRKALSLETLLSEQLNIEPKKKEKKKNDNAMVHEEESEDKKEASDDELLVPDFDNKKDALAILPTVIKALVDKRRQVKNLLKNETSEERKMNLDIRQKAIKLIANSIYGCLGFAHSRFYTKPIAAFITRKGRETLESSVKLVTTKLNFDVIYGDTDSIMINTNSENLGEALRVGNQIKIEINKQFRNKAMEIDIDGIFRPLLLIKKKKYAAMKVSNLGDVLLGNGTVEPKFFQEIKGLDMVRRDWCDLAKQCSKYVLDTLLSGEAKEECQAKIGDYFKKLNEDIKSDPEKRIKDFILTKQLTKRPNQYPDADNQPHVVIAKRLIQNGESENNLVGRFVHYIICKKDSNKLSDKAFHVTEFINTAKGDKSLEIDQNYYKLQQILPTISRLCEFIPGINIGYFAECLGVDGSRYNNSGKKGRDHFQEDIQKYFDEDYVEEATTHDKLEISFVCLKCNLEEPYVGVFRKNGDIGLICPKCKLQYEIEIVLNKVTLLIKKEIKRYYDGYTKCFDDFCTIDKTKQIRYEKGKCISFQCQGSGVAPTLKESRVYDNLIYLKKLFEPSKEDKESDKSGIYKHYENSFNRITEKIKETIVRNKIQLKEIFSFD